MTGAAVPEQATRLMRVILTPYDHQLAKIEDVVGILNEQTPEERRRLVAILLQTVGIPALPSRTPNTQEPKTSPQQFDRIRKVIGLKIRRHELTFTEPLRQRKPLAAVADAVAADLEYLQPMGQGFQAAYLIQLASEGRAENIIPYVETGELPPAMDHDALMEAAFARPGLFARMVALAGDDDIDVAQQAAALAVILRGEEAGGTPATEAALAWFIIAMTEHIARAMSNGGGHMHPSFVVVRPGGQEFPADTGPPKTQLN